MKKLKDSWIGTLSLAVAPGGLDSAEMITGGGSPREFYRIRGKGGSVILLESENVDEMREYVALARFYGENGVSVPNVLQLSADGRVALISDCGSISLNSVAKGYLARGEESAFAGIYKKVLDEMVKIQSLSVDSVPDFVGRRLFDREHYRWESAYFVEKCVGGYFGLDFFGDEGLNKDLETLADLLAGEPRRLVHRDFQSQNVLVDGGKIYIIDIQSARLGSIFYDAASLLRDPYVDMPGEIQDLLLDYYLKKVAENRLYPCGELEILREKFNLVASSRLMQALGAYGNLGLFRGKPAFLEHIPPALRLLRQTLALVEGFDSLKKLVERVSGII